MMAINIAEGPAEKKKLSVLQVASNPAGR